MESCDRSNLCVLKHSCVYVGVFVYKYMVVHVHVLYVYICDAVLVRQLYTTYAKYGFYPYIIMSCSPCIHFYSAVVVCVYIIMYT